MTEKKILIVDDDQIFLKILEKTLLSAGYSVAKAENGKEAILVAREWHPDLIILDIMMPEMDGGETAEALKSDSSTKNTPIIFLTSLLTKKEEGQGKPLLGRKAMAKPLYPEDLLHEIKEYI